VEGTITGGKKASITNKQKYGENFYKIIAAKGGRVKVPKGFAMMDREKVVEAGRAGGYKSKRGKSK